MEVNDKRPVLLIRYEDQDKEETADLAAVQSVDENTSTKKTEKDSAKTLAGSKGKKSSKKQKEKKEEKEAIKVETLDNKPSNMQIHQTSAMSMCESTSQLADENQLDDNLILIIQCAKSKIVPTDDYQTHVRVLADVVSDTMGGPICKNRLSESGYEMEIVEIKRARNSNIIPVGLIKKGLYRERALLFKLLADIFGVPATLGRHSLRDNYKNNPVCIPNRPTNQNNQESVWKPYFKRKVREMFQSSPLAANIYIVYTTSNRIAHRMVKKISTCSFKQKKLIQKIFMIEYRYLGDVFVVYSVQG